MASKRIVKSTIFLALLGAVLLAAYETFFWFTHVYENDAQVKTELTNISSQVNGKIELLTVKEGQKIKRGQSLVKLIDDDIRLNIAALKTELRLKAAERSKLVSEKIAFETELKAELITQREKIKTSKLEYDSLKERLKLAEKNIGRVKFLFGKELIPEDKLIQEQDKFLVLKGDLNVKSARVAVAKKELLRLRSTIGQAEIIGEKIKILEVEHMRIKDNIQMQEIELSYRTIVSPIDGIVGRIYKYRGEYIEDGINILTLHNPARFWIEAYIDESQIRHVSVGKDVLIDFEAYPFRNFYGKVTNVGSLTTAQTGLKTRSSGSSFGGSIERVPVRIAMKNPPDNLTPGMQVNVNIRIYENIRLW